MTFQLNLPGGGNQRDALELPPGMRYWPDSFTAEEERKLVSQLRELPFQEFDFHGYKGKRRVVSFGWKYDFSMERAQKTAAIPEFLFMLRRRAADLADLEAERFEQALVTEYRPGAGIGWHRDKPVFGDVVGFSLLSECVLRFRRKVETPGSEKRRKSSERFNLIAEPRSAYLLTGPSRAAWEHSILRVNSLRYSVTFRTLR